MAICKSNKHSCLSCSAAPLHSPSPSSSCSLNHSMSAGNIGGVGGNAGYLAVCAWHISWRERDYIDPLLLPHPLERMPFKMLYKIPWNQILNETQMIFSVKMCFKGMWQKSMGYNDDVTPSGRHRWWHLMHTSGRVNASRT